MIPPQPFFYDYTSRLLKWAERKLRRRRGKRGIGFRIKPGFLFARSCRITEEFPLAVWRSLPVSGAAANTALHNGDDLFKRSGTVLFQPLCHNSHKTPNIKGRHIGLLLLRNVKAFQNRGEHMPEQSIIGFLHLQGGAVFYGSFEKIFVHLHILQIRHQILGCQQIQLFQGAVAESGYECCWILLHMGDKLFVHILNAFG